MKVTITYEFTTDDDGEDSVVSFEKEGLHYLEDVLNAMGRSLYGAGFTYVEQLEATTKNNEKFKAHF